MNTTFTSRQHGSRCRQYRKRWEQNNRCHIPGLSHPHPLSRHQPLSTTYRPLQTHRPRIYASDHLSLMLVAPPKDRLIPSHALAAPSSVHLLPKCHLHLRHRARASWNMQLDRHTNHVTPTRRRNTTRDCHHYTLSRPHGLPHHLLHDLTHRTLRTLQHRLQLTNLPPLSQLNT